MQCMYSNIRTVIVLLVQEVYPFLILKAIDIISFQRVTLVDFFFIYNLASDSRSDELLLINYY